MPVDNSVEKDVYEELEKSFKKRGLGRGLNALFEDEEGVYPQADADGQTPGSTRRMLDISQIEPGAYQPRKVFDEQALSELSDSIKQHGMLQPILVRPKEGATDLYEIVAGERRWRAATKAKLHEIPVIIRDLTDKETLEIGIIENLQREQLNPIDEAQALQDLINLFKYTQEEAAIAIGKSRPYVANMLRLTKLPEKVIAYLKEGSLSVGHARTLVTAPNPEELADQIIQGNLSVRAAEALSGTPAKAKNTKIAKTKDVNTLALEKEVSEKLGLAVSIDMKGERAGTVNIKFKDLDQLDHLLHRISKA